MDQKERVERRYDRWSRLYDVLDLGGVTYQKRAAVELLRLGGNSQVIDIGTGTGAILPYVASFLGEGGKVTGIDISPAMVERANARIHKKGIGDRAEAMVGDAESLPFEDSSFDSALATFALTSFPDPERSLAEVHRVLRGGGRFSMLDTGRPRGGGASLHYALLRPVVRGIGYTRIDLDLPQMIRETGFRIVQIHRFRGSLAYCALCRKA